MGQLRHQVERVAGQLRPASRPVAPWRAQISLLPVRLPAELVDVPAEIERDATPVDHGSLPLPDLDHMSLGSLRGPLRTLDVVSLVQLRDWERAHGNRVPVLTMIENRLAKVLVGDAPVREGGAHSRNRATSHRPQPATPRFPRRKVARR